MLWRTCTFLGYTFVNIAIESLFQSHSIGQGACRDCIPMLVVIPSQSALTKFAVEDFSSSVYIDEDNVIIHAGCEWRCNGGCIY